MTYCIFHNDIMQSHALLRKIQGCPLVHLGKSQAQAFQIPILCLICDKLNSVNWNKTHVNQILVKRLFSMSWTSPHTWAQPGYIPALTLSPMSKVTSRVKNYLIDSPTTSSTSHILCLYIALCVLPYWGKAFSLDILTLDDVIIALSLLYCFSSIWQ